MDSTAITSAAQAVHQELVGKLAVHQELVGKLAVHQELVGKPAEQARIIVSGISYATPGHSQHPRPKPPGTRVTQSRRPSRHPPHYLP